MGKLAEFLAEKAGQLESVRAEREELVRDWTRAVDRLLAQLEKWVKEADPTGVLTLTRRDHSFNDELMGRYTVPGLVFDLDGRTAEVVPVARRVVASIPVPGESKPRSADGRVDLCGDDLGTFSVLYRVRDGEADRWFATYPGVWNIRQGRDEVKLLSPESFELDLMSLLQ